MKAIILKTSLFILISTAHVASATSMMAKTKGSSSLRRVMKEKRTKKSEKIPKSKKEKLEKVPKEKNEKKNSKKKDKQSKDTKRVLKNALKAVGGKKSIQQLNQWMMKVSGENYIDFEATHPRDIIPTNMYDRTYYHELDNDNLRVDSIASPLFEIFPSFGIQTYSRVINGKIGTLDQQALGAPRGPLPSGNVAALKRQQMFLNPHILLKMIIENPSIVSYGGTSLDGNSDILVIENNVRDIHLYVEQSTGNIITAETYESHPLLGDTKIVVEYEEWDIEAETADGRNAVMFPRIVTLTGEDGLLLTEVRYEVNIDVSFPPDTFQLENVASTYLDTDQYQFGLDSHHLVEGFFALGFLYPTLPGTMSPVELIPDVLYLLPDNCNSLFINYSEGVVLVEAPFSDFVATKLLAKAKELFPDKDITHLLQTHHHVDHAGAVRKVLANGTELVIGYGVKSFWEEIITRENTIRPDGLTESTAGDITEVSEDGSRIIINETELVVTVYHTVVHPHAIDNILIGIETLDQVYIYTADLYNAGFGFTAIVGGPLGLLTALKEKNLINDDCTSDKPLSIISAHGFFLTLEDSIAEIEATDGVSCIDIGKS